MADQLHSYPSKSMAEDVDTAFSITRRFLEGTTAHGISRIAREKSTFRKLAWAGIFCLAVGYFCMHVSHLLKAYLAYQVSVNVDVTHR